MSHLIWIYTVASLAIFFSAWPFKTFYRHHMTMNVMTDYTNDWLDDLFFMDLSTVF